MALSGKYDGIFEESVSAVTATNSVELGARRYSDGIEYVYVYNAGGEEIGPLQGCTVSAVSGYSVTVSSVCGANRLAGVPINATLTTATYGWVAQQGHTNVSGNTQTLVGLGSYLQLGDNGTFSTAAVDVCGFAASAMTGSAGTFNAFFKANLW